MDIKEKTGCIAENFAEAVKNPGEKEYCLPDGNKLTIGDERFRVGEALFNPSLTGQESDSGVH